MQLKYCRRLFQSMNLKKKIAGRWRWTSGFLGTFADLLCGPVTVNSGLVWSLIFPPHIQAQQRQLKTVNHLAAPNRLPRASNKQRLKLICTRVPPKTSQTANPVASFRHHSRIQLASKTTYPIPWQATDPAEVDSALRG